MLGISSINYNYHRIAQESHNSSSWRPQMVYYVDSSAYITSKVPPPKVECPCEDCYGISAQDETFFGQFMCLDSAIANNLIETCRKLAGQIRDINGELHFVESTLPSYTLLHAAIEKNRPECAEILLEHGANPDIPNSEGVTPRMMAEKSKNDRLISLVAQKTLKVSRKYNNELGELFSVSEVKESLRDENFSERFERFAFGAARHLGLDPRDYYRSNSPSDSSESPRKKDK